MAKVMIILEDTPSGVVVIDTRYDQPSKTGEEPTNAEIMAMMMIKAITDESMIDK